MLGFVVDDKAPSRPSFFVSRWSTESHTFNASRGGEFGPTLEDVVSQTMLPMYREINAMDRVLEEDDEEIL